MKKLRSINNYDIIYDELIPQEPLMIVVAIHGFAGDRFSGCIELLKEQAYKNKIGVVNFDLPAHGESPVNGDKLTVKNCLNDINKVVEHFQNKYPNIPITAFATSFGGYLALLYNSIYKNKFSQIILRAPASDMYSIVINNIIKEEEKKSLLEKGFFEYGFERIIKINKTFVEELKNNDIFEIYKDYKNPNIHIIHGDKDDLVNIEYSKKLSKQISCSLDIIKGADHRFKKPGELEEVVNISINIYKNYLNKML